MSIDGDTATLDETVSVDFTQAEFIYAQLVDHEVTEGFDATADTGVSNDDGDGFVEMVKRSGSTYKWSASVDSTNIPDGPAEIHIVAFDQAGNSNYGYVKTSIQNNRPRISRVMLATDLNGNGKFDYYNESSSILNDLSKDNTVASGTQFGEFVFYSTLKALDSSSDKAGEAQAKITLSGRTFKVKKDLLVLPEFVGGNGKLIYGASFDNDEAVSQPVSGTKSLAFSADNLKLADKKGTTQKAESLIQQGENSANENYGGAVVQMDNTLEDIKKLDDGKVKYLAFTFWDSTSETTAGTDSLWAMINIPAVIDVVDDTKPTGTIKPFWWKSKEDSSFVYDEEENPLGHIDIDAGKTNTRPGVSGQVYINGTAYDETRIAEIHVVKPDGTAGGDGDEKIIWYESGENAGWKRAEGAEILSEQEPSQDGHTVEWRYKIDMTPYGVATQKTVKTYVVDSQENTMESPSENTAQTTAVEQTALYKMDFVPYIKDIYTTSMGSSNRSRLGRYPVRAGEELTIEGMNFAKDSSYTVNFYKTAIDGTIESSPVTDESETGTIEKDGKITVTAPQYSRWVEVVVNDVATKNNTNVNGGYNIESGYVAKDSDNGLQTANANGTNFWTDDRYISVWNTSTTFDGSINPHSGLIKKIRAEDGANNDGKVGLKAKSSTIDLTDMTDGYLGFISSDDMRVYAYQNTTKKVAMSPTSDVSLFTAPVDTVDMVVLGGLPYYVLQTNYVGNVNANCWGPGLMLSREGFAYDKSVYEGTNSLSESSLQWIIERQGSTNSATGRNSSDGYDSVLYQFKNPRIAGWHTDSPEEDDKTYYSSNNKRLQLDYIYVSYYDNYAKCLKFAAFRSGRDASDNRITTINTTANNQWGGGNAGDYELVAEVRSANGNMTTGATVVAGYDTTTNNPTSFTEKAGEWSDIMVDATSGSPIPVIVYYNETNKCLEVARGNSKFPKSKNYGASSVTSLSGADAWTKTKNIKPAKGIDFGRYVSAAMDSAGNIHLAAQDATNSKLYYMFLTKNTDGTYAVDTTKTTLVDSTSGSGRWTDIELSDSTGTTPATCKPVISYINTSYLNTTNGTKVAFAESFDSTTGKLEFEAMTDPAIWQTGDQRTSVLSSVKETATDNSIKSPVAVGFNSDMLALDFLRGED